MRTTWLAIALEINKKQEERYFPFSSLSNVGSESFVHCSLFWICSGYEAEGIFIWPAWESGWSGHKDMRFIDVVAE